MLKRLWQWMAGDAKSSLSKEESARTMAAFETISDAVIGLNDENKVELCNKAACKLLGMPAQELKGKSIIALIPSLPSISSLNENILYDLELLDAHKHAVSVELTVSRTPFVSGLSTIFTMRNTVGQKKIENYLTMQHAITQILAESDLLEVAAPKILKIMCETLHLQVGELWTVDEKTQTLRCGTTSYAGENYNLKEFCRMSQTLTFKCGEGLPGKVWEKGTLGWMEDASAQNNFPRSPWALAANLHTGFAYPIFFENKVIGVFDFFMNRFAPLDNSLLKVLENISNQLGVFIEREIALKNEGAVKQKTAPKAPRVSHFRDKTVLIISADAKAHAEVQKGIEKVGFNVLRAASGPEGIKLARQHKPKVIALDISMTVTLDSALMDEWITLSELKSDQELCRIPLVVMTKDSQESLGFVLGDMEFLNKPIDIKIMINKVKQLVPEGTTPSLLVVDDDAPSREILTQVAKKAGWKFIEAANGREGLEKLDEEPTVILLDLMMPEMDGFTMINEMQKNEKWKKIPVIVVSAKNLSADEQAMLTKYSQGVFNKGAYSRQGLVDAICEQIK